MDEIIRAVTRDGSIKISAISARGLVERARALHNTSPLATAALGRTLCAASLLGNMLKEPDASLTVRVNGGGPIGTIMAVSDSDGNVRGYAQNPSIDLPKRPDGKLDVGAAVGKAGTITVSRDFGLKEPYISSSALVSGEIAEDLAFFLLESEQLASACGLGVLVDTDLTVKCAGGFILSLLPGAPDELISLVEANIAEMGAVTGILEKGAAEDIICAVLKGLEPEPLSVERVEYRCNCSRERIRQAVALIGKTDLREIVECGEGIEIICDFCSTVYDFTHEETQDILKSGAYSDEVSEEKN